MYSEDYQILPGEFNWDEKTNSKGQTAKQVLLNWLVKGENMRQYMMHRDWEKGKEMVKSMDKYLTEQGIQGCAPRYIVRELELTIDKYIKAKDLVLRNRDSSDDEDSSEEGKAFLADKTQRDKVLELSKEFFILDPLIGDSPTVLQFVPSFHEKMNDTEHLLKYISKRMNGKKKKKNNSSSSTSRVENPRRVEKPSSKKTKAPNK